MFHDPVNFVDPSGKVLPAVAALLIGGAGAYPEVAAVVVALSAGVGLALGLDYLHSENSADSTEKAIRSLEDRIAEHEKKLADYLDDPDAYDNNLPFAQIWR